MKNATRAVRMAQGEAPYTDSRGTKAALTKLRRKLDGKEAELAQLQVMAGKLETEIQEIRRRITSMEKTLGTKKVRRARKTNSKKAA